MLHGDISNEPVGKIGFRFEELLRRESDGHLNRSGKAYLESVAHLDVEVVIFTTGPERKAAAFCYKWGVPYTRVLAVDSILELEQVCREQRLIAYYDSDKELLQRIKSRANQKETAFNLWTLQDNYYQE